jgi:hypothetical protein
MQTATTRLDLGRPMSYARWMWRPTMTGERHQPSPGTPSADDAAHAPSLRDLPLFTLLTGIGGRLLWRNANTPL